LIAQDGIKVSKYYHILNSGFCSLGQNPNDRFVPEAEVNIGILNVGFGDVSYQGVKESGATYIGMGACV